MPSLLLKVSMAMVNRPLFASGGARDNPMADPFSLIRPLVQNLHGYVPGEQPKIKGLIKLNTNENPYPPAPKVIKAIRAAADQRLRLYPNPTADRLRTKL